MKFKLTETQTQEILKIRVMSVKSTVQSRGISLGEYSMVMVDGGLQM